MKKIFFLLAAFMFVTSNIFAQDAEKLSGTLSTSMNHYSTYNESYPITNVNDGSYTTKFWSNGGPSANDHITMTLAQEASIGEIVLYFESGDRPEHAVVEVSADNSVWESVGTITLSDISSESTYTCNAEGISAMYVRLKFTQSQSNWFQIREFEVYETPSQLEPRTISVSVNDATMGTAYVNEEGTTEATEQVGSVKITAVPAEGYTFVNWTLNGEEVSTSLSYRDKTEGDKAYVANFRALEVYNVSVSVNNAAMGSAVSTAEGAVTEGTEITLVATAADDSRFVSWTVNGEVVSEEATFVTTVVASVEYVANFEIKPEKATIESIDISMAHYSSRVAENAIDGSYSTYYDSANTQEVGETVAVTLAEETNVGEVKLYMPSYASYRPVKAQLQTSLDNSEWVDVEGGEFTNTGGVSDEESGRYLIVVKVGGVIAKHVRFIITEASTSYLQVYEFEVYKAAVELPARAISVSVNDATMGSAFIGTEGVTSVEEQTGLVKISAVANEGYAFVNWTLNGEEVSTSAVYADKTEGDKAYVANFVSLGTYNVSVSVNNSIMGTVEASKVGEVFDQTKITLTATANEGYEFINWTVNGEEVSTDNPYEATVSGDVEYVANFRLVPTKLAIERAESSMKAYGGYVADNMVDGSYSTMFDTTQRQNAHEGDVTATIVLAEESVVGEVKIYFSGNYRPTAAKIQVSTDYETWVDVEGTEFLGADAVDASDVQSGARLITVDCDGVVAKYVRMFVTEPAAQWLTIYEFEAYEAPVNVAPRTISVSVNDATMGSAYVGVAGTTVLEDQTSAVRMTATVASNAYRFVNWTLNGEEVSTSATIVDRTEGDKEYVANFEAKPIYEATVASANTDKGTVELTAPEIIYEGDEVTFTATAVDGYKFIAWTSGTDTISVANPYTITMTESLSLVANFDRDPLLNRANWTITASSEETSGEGAGNGVATCIIDGKTNTHWHSAWKESSPAYPHWFMIDMKESKAFDAFEYVSRGAGSSTDDSNNNGNIVNYQLYTSDTEIDPAALENATLVTSGQFTYDGANKVHRVEFNSVKGQYVMLYATGQSANGGKHASCVEFYLYSNAFAVSVASSNSEIGSAYIGQAGVTSVGCSVEGTDAVTITAVPAPKYQFVNWTLNGEVVSTDAVYTTDLVTESRAYVANFEFAPVAPRTITSAVNNASKGSVVFTTPASTESSVVSDNIVVMEAVPATTDDFFVNWTINGVVVGTETTYEYTDAEAATVQANFITKYVVTVEQVTGGTISVKTGGTAISSGDRVLEGNYIKLSVSENNRKELKKLFVNGEDVFLQYKYNPDYCVQVTGPMTITAEFGEPKCIVTWEYVGNGYIEVWEYDTYDEEAEMEGTLELPVQPAGEQYAYGDEIPFLTSYAIFVFPGEGEELLSLTINGEEYELYEDCDLFVFGDIYSDNIESATHIVATFTGEYTGVENAKATETNVYAVAGGIVVEVAEAATASVYSIAGVLVSEQTVSEKATIAMEKGAYIVKVADKVAKVIVK